MRPRLLLSAVPCLFATGTATAIPEPQPEAEANPEALAEAQTYTNNAPFSGAIYIVNPDGQPAQGSCPVQASLSCGDQGHPSWCCPGGCSCVAPQNQNGYIGCCPVGSNCAGTIASVQTVVVTAQAQQSVPVVYVPPQQYTTVPNNPYTVTAAAGGFCQTLTMHGPGLPTVTQGQCGTILIVSDGSGGLKAVGFDIAGIVLLVHLAVARVFR